MVAHVVCPRLSSFVPGPMDPSTKRGRSAVACRAQAARAISAASRFSARVQLTSSSSNSAKTSRLAPNVSVSIASAPAARNDSWIDITTSGRLRTRMSTQFSRPR